MLRMINITRHDSCGFPEQLSRAHFKNGGDNSAVAEYAGEHCVRREPVLVPEPAADNSWRNRSGNRVQNSKTGIGFIQSVEVNPRNTRGLQFFTLLDRKFHADFELSLTVIADLFQLLSQSLWNL